MRRLKICRFIPFTKPVSGFGHWPIGEIAIRTNRQEVGIEAPVILEGRVGHASEIPLRLPSVAPERRGSRVVGGGTSVAGGRSGGAADSFSMMRPSDEIEVYLYRGIVDMRKSINGLSVIVEEELGLSPFGPKLFVFCNRQKDKIKILYWERSGLRRRAFLGLGVTRTRCFR